MRPFDEVYETLPGNGWLLKDEAELLYRVASQESGPILEVGAYQGRSTVLLASLERLVYVIDPFDEFDNTLSGDEIARRFIDNLSSRRITNVILYRQRIEDLVDQSDRLLVDWKPPIGFAYLDGDHSYNGTLNQIHIARKAGAKTMCLHDYALDGGGVNVKQAIKDSGLSIIEIVQRMAWCKV